MIGPITDFSINSVELVSDKTKITFSFIKPTGNIGGYYLFIDTSSGLVHVDTRVDALHPQDGDVNTYDVGAYTYYEYTLPDSTTDGKLVDFYLQALSTTRELSSVVGPAQVYTYPSKPNNLFVKYDGIQVDLTWNSVMQDTFVAYNIYRDYCAPVNGTSYDSDTNTLTNPLFTVGKHVWVIDTFKRSQWFGRIETEGEFSLTSTGLTNYSDNSVAYRFSIDNVTIYLSSNAPVLLDQTSTGAYTDESYLFDRYYIYSISTVGLGGRISNRVYYQCHTIETTMSYPYLRSVDSSSTTILNNQYWKSIKATLVDKGFYNLSPFAIPYSKDTTYNLKGYLGVANCKLDVYINGIYGFTTSTGIYGEFDINYAFKKGSIEFVFQARDRLNVKFSRKTAPFTITTMNIYTWFSVVGKQYEAARTELNSIKSDVSLDTCRDSYFEDRFSPFTGLYKVGDESEEKFRALSSAIYRAYEYVSYKEALTMVFDAFRDNVPEIDHYEIYFNDSLYDTQRTGYTFTPTSTGLGRGNYYYGISSHKANGEETPVSVLRVDRRWWPDPYVCTNVLMWDYMSGAEGYRIYRGTSPDNLLLMTSTGSNFFIDINGYATTSTGPVAYNFTDMEAPTGLHLYDKFGVNNLFLRLKKPGSLTILLFGTGTNLLQSYDIDRLMYLLGQFIPPEIKYRLIFSNDDKVILYPGGTVVDLTEPTPAYAYYGLSYYYSTSVAEEVYA